MFSSSFVQFSWEKRDTNNSFSWSMHERDDIYMLRRQHLKELLYTEQYIRTRHSIVNVRQLENTTTLKAGCCNMRFHHIYDDML